MDEGVQELVDQFYAALNQVYAGDAEPLLALWSREPYVSAMHSLGDHEVGFDQVSAEWMRVAARVAGGTVNFESVALHANDAISYAVGIERGTILIDGAEVAVNLRVTNIFERQGGEWKIVHHHADTAPSIERRIG